jgi:hypothetical protein
VNERRDPDTGALTTDPLPAPKPIESRRTGLAETRIDEERTPEQAPRATRVAIRTWADEAIEGLLVEETAEALVVDVTPEGALSGRTVRRVARASVQSISYRAP